MVVPEAFFRLFEVASHDVHKSVDVDFWPLLERVQVVDRYPAWKIVPFVVSDNLIVRVQMWSRFKVVSEHAVIPSDAQVLAGAPATGSTATTDTRPAPNTGR